MSKIYVASEDAEGALALMKSMNEALIKQGAWQDKFDSMTPDEQEAEMERVREEAKARRPFEIVADIEDLQVQMDALEEELKTFRTDENTCEACKGEGETFEATANASSSPFMECYECEGRGFVIE